MRPAQKTQKAYSATYAASMYSRKLFDSMSVLSLLIHIGRVPRPVEKKTARLQPGNSASPRPLPTGALRRTRTKGPSAINAPNSSAISMW